jgi:tetratricopeptide (TPR) repeat protein
MLFDILDKTDLLEAKSYSSENIKEVANQGGVNHVLQGGYVKAGDTYRISYALQDASSGELLGSESMEGKGEESIFSMVDEMTKSIKQSFKLSDAQISSDVDKAIGAITTSSPEAYKHYSEGIKAYNKSNPQQALRCFGKAIAIDPNFAMAHMMSATVYFNLADQSKTIEYSKKAYELSDRVSDRERYLIQGEFVLNSEKTYAKAIEVLNKLLELYPEDGRGNHLLGWIYLELEQWDKAIERYAFLLQNYKEVAVYSESLAEALRAKGLYKKAVEVLEDYLYSVTDNHWIRNRLALTYLCQGKYDLALIEADKSFNLDPSRHQNIGQRGDIFLCKEDFDNAKNDYHKLLGIDEGLAQFWGRKGLGALYFFLGKFKETEKQLKLAIETAEKTGQRNMMSSAYIELANFYLKSEKPREALKICNKAIDSAEEAIKLAWLRYALHLRGLIYIKMDSMDSAQQVAEELLDLIRGGMNDKAMSLYYHLLGKIELKRENYSKAVEHFQDAVSLLPFQFGMMVRGNFHSAFLDSLGSAHYKSGNLEKAKEEYARIPSLALGKLYYCDIYVKSFYMLGKICEQQGDTTKALKHYQKFLSLWKDADPGIAEVEDARERLAGLEN